MHPRSLFCIDWYRRYKTNYKAENLYKNRLTSVFCIEKKRFEGPFGRKKYPEINRSCMPIRFDFLFLIQKFLNNIYGEKCLIKNKKKACKTFMENSNWGSKHLKFSRKVTWELIQIKLPNPQSALADFNDNQCPIKQINFVIMIFSASHNLFCRGNNLVFLLPKNSEYIGFQCNGLILTWCYTNKRAWWWRHQYKFDKKFRWEHFDSYKVAKRVGQSKSKL